MKQSSPQPTKTPPAQEQKRATAKTYIAIFLALAFTVANIVTLVHNFTLHAENVQLQKSIDYAQLQTTYAENCQIISDFIPGLTPPLVRFRDNLGIEQLYYCTQVTVNKPKPIHQWDDECWLIRKSGSSYSTEHFDLPGYNEMIGQTLYHPYVHYIEYSHSYTQELETYSIHEANGFYYEIEANYSQFPANIDINDPDSVAAFLAEKITPTATIYGIEILQPSPDQVETVTYDAKNVIPNNNTQKTCCGCTGCICDDCKCTG